MSITETTPVTRIVDGTEVPAAGRYELDPSHSHVGFSVRHLMVSKTKGRFADVLATIVIDDDPLASSVEVEIPVASVDTRDETRDGHLRSPDFFAADAHPKMTFSSKGVRQQGRGWVVDGELTFNGVTRPVPLAVELNGFGPDPYGGTRSGFSATAEISRKDFGLAWNLPLETGGVVIGDKVQVAIEVEGVLRPPAA